MALTKEERLKRDKLRFEEMNYYERDLRKKGYSVVGGIDEVGRGPLAGPVVSACVVLPKNFDVLGIYDSKKVSEKKRKMLYSEIMANSLGVGVGFVSNKVIDEINILEATKLAMSKAIKNCDRILSRKGLGNIECLIIDALELENIKKKQIPLVKGDEKSISVAAASIVAKVIRDNYMEYMASIYKGYFFESHKGYGTKKHYEALRENGMTPIHRKSFLKKIL